MEKSLTNSQNSYYSETADAYDDLHLSEGDIHYRALSYLEGIIKLNNINSILDIGAGTGRVALYLKQIHPALKILSIEPIEELRQVGYSKGLSKQELLYGDVYNLQFQDSAFDLVCAFGVFHHLKNPSLALAEMQRVSSLGLYISDSNNFGQGSLRAKSLKQFLRGLKLWNLFVFIRTKGKKYTISEGDGVAYSFSIFNLEKIMKDKFELFFLGTVPSKGNLFKTASHSVIFAKKIISKK